MPRSVFVHETIDIVGQGQYDYMEHVAKEPTNFMPDMTSPRFIFCSWICRRKMASGGEYLGLWN